MPAKLGAIGKHGGILVETSGSTKKVTALIFGPIILILVIMVVIVSVTWESPQIVPTHESAKSGTQIDP